MARTPDDFFETIECELEVVIPSHIKKQLTLHGFANRLSLETMSESDLTEIERFAKSELHLVVPEEDISDYLGRFSNNAQNFLFFGGEKKLLWKIQEHVKTPVQTQLKSQPKSSSTTRNRKNSHAAKNNTPEMAIQNLDDERISLSNLVTKNIKESLPLLDKNLQAIVSSKIDKINYNCQLDSNGDVYCNIGCVLCNVEVKVKKYRKGPNASSRWLVGNLKQHFLKHRTEGNQGGKKRINTIYKYMDPETSESRTSLPVAQIVDSDPSTSFDRSSQPPPVKVTEPESNSNIEGTEIAEKSEVSLPQITELSPEINDPDFHEGKANSSSVTLCPVDESILGSVSQNLLTRKSLKSSRHLPPVKATKTKSNSNIEEIEIAKKSKVALSKTNEVLSKIDDSDFHKGRANSSSVTICPANESILGSVPQSSISVTSLDISRHPSPIKIPGKIINCSHEETETVSVKRSTVPRRRMNVSSTSKIDDPDFREGRTNDSPETIICPADSKTPPDHSTQGSQDVAIKDTSNSKWKQEKYSRRQRERRKREKQTNQPVITNYLVQITEISKLIQENNELKNRLLEELPLMLPGNKTLDSSRGANENIQCLLTLLQKSADSNENKVKNNKYEPDLIQFCLYLYIIGGRLMYETLHANLKKVIPSLSTVQRHINNSNCITEGSLRFAELSDFLSKRNLPKVIWISEDATGITGRIQYCSQTNTIVGFVSPFGRDGLPRRDHFPADSVQNIQKYFRENDRAKYAYVVMAQSPIDKSASFCVNVFGTDNRFTHKDVARRWVTMKKEAENVGIRILGFSSDGDTRLMKTMRNFSNFQCRMQNQEWKWFQMDLNNGDICVQDTVHVATKMRTRLLNESVNLQIGDYKASATHLKDVVIRCSKDKHLLTLSDLKPDDKMNFRAAEKITSPLVETVLRDIIDHPEGTIAFLKLTRLILQAFLNKNETLYTRIYNMWYSVFFLRIWRDWLHKTDNLSVTKNFVSLNCYLCFELNAHALIKLVRLYRDDSNLSEACMFTPWLFSSQPCEQIFRATRSLTSTFSTVVNFSVQDILKRLTKIQQVNNVISDLSDKVIFPREAKHTKMGNNNFATADIKFMTDQEIQECVMKALSDVKEDCKTLKIRPASKEAWQEVKVFNTNIEKYDPLIDENDIDVHVHDNSDETAFAMEDRLIDLADSDNEGTNPNPPSDIADIHELNDTTYGEYLNMPDLGTKHKSDSSFLKIKVGEDIKTIRKSSLCWLLNEQSTKLSADRLIRVRGNTNIESKAKTKNASLDASTPSDSTEATGGTTIAISITVGNYYAVFYDDAWYIGRVIEEMRAQLNDENRDEDSRSYRIKFLRESSAQFQWPRRDDVQIVEECFIFFGPINMTGSSPMKISTIQRNKINKQYREMKRDRRDG